MGDRTAEEFVHKLADGRWFLADAVGAAPGKLTAITDDYRMISLSENEVIAARTVTKYTTKRAAKRAAQRMIERVSDWSLEDFIRWQLK